MNRDSPRDMVASVRDRLLKLARSRGEDNQLVLIRYASERLLYRLSLSPHHSRFILKGARLFELWTGETHRPTRDLDFLAYGSPDLEDLVPVFRSILQQPVEHDDGLTFIADSVTGIPARQDQEYRGASLKLLACLGAAQIPLQVDLGFGDAVTPGPILAELPVLLPFPPATALTYPRETVIAEKLQAMVALGIANSRMKDFYDLWFLSRRFDFEGATLSRAIRATFGRRATELPVEPPLALTSDFSEDASKRTQWSAFVRKSRLVEVETPLAEVVTDLAAFLMPPLAAAAADAPFDSRWSASGRHWEQSTKGAAELAE